jgi:multiple sugar transport system substrate-binding protein
MIRGALASLVVALAVGDAAAGTTITVATFPDLDRAAKAALPRWHAAHPDIDVKIVSLQYADHHTAMTTALATGSGLPDVMAIDFKFIGKFAGSRRLRGPEQAAVRRARAAQPVRRLHLRAGDQRTGRTRGAAGRHRPRHAAVPRDLVAKAGLTEADLTKSWDSFIAAGVKLKAATGANLLADSADIVDIVLRSNLQPGEGIYFDRAGKVLVDSPRFVHAFELGRAAHKAGIDAGTTIWTNEWVAGFRSNKIAGAMMGAWLAGHLKNWLAPDTAGKWRAAPLPAGATASYGGSFYAIPKRAAHKPEAWAFVRFMTATSRRSSIRCARSTPSPRCSPRSRIPVIDEPMPFLGGQKARELWRDIAAKVPAIPVDKYDSMATDVIRAEYQNVITQGKDIRAALADAKSLIEHRARR